MIRNIIYSINTELYHRCNIKPWRYFFKKNLRHFYESNPRRGIVYQYLYIKSVLRPFNVIPSIIDDSKTMQQI